MYDFLYMVDVPGLTCSHAPMESAKLFLKEVLDLVLAKLLLRMRDCLLYTSDAADDMQCVDLGCRRIIKKKKKKNEFFFFKQKTAYFFFSSRRRHTR